jgi:hypothetical protein
MEKKKRGFKEFENENENENEDVELSENEIVEEEDELFEGMTKEEIDQLLDEADDVQYHILTHFRLKFLRWIKRALKRYLFP